MASDENVKGGCLCGSIRYEAIGKPFVVAYCHCTDCRGITGAPVVAWAGFDSQNVRFTKGERKIFESSPGIVWGFCDQCSSSLTWEGVAFGRPITEFHISTLDKPEEFVPDRHWYESERLPWFDIADNLPRYSEVNTGDEEPTHRGPKR